MIQLILLLFSVTAIVMPEDMQRPPCTLIHDGIDIQTKEYRKETAPQFFFHYTPPTIKNDMQTDNLLEAEAKLLQLHESYYLELNIHLFSQRAARQYGEIETGSLLQLTLINGQKHKIKSLSLAQGIFDPESRHVTYAVSYMLDKSAIKAMSKYEIDQIGIQWSSGYEEYVIYEIDLIKNLLTCLE